MKITIAILKALSPRDQVHEFKDFNQLQFKYCDGDDFNQVQLKLSKILFGKRFLLVLDDVWNINDYERWNRLRAPFRLGATGSKIVVTTRHTNVASLMRANNFHHFLKPLSNDDCWNVFVKHAFENKNVNKHSNLKLIQQRIIEKCSGLPLAAKVLDGLLRSTPQDEWEYVLSRKIWNRSGVIPVLRIKLSTSPFTSKKMFCLLCIVSKGLWI